jgi:hypothetical protein
MMLKTVYGPPTAGEERSEDVAPEGDNEIRESGVANVSPVIAAEENGQEGWRGPGRQRRRRG